MLHRLIGLKRLMIRRGEYNCRDMLLCLYFEYRLIRRIMQ